MFGLGGKHTNKGLQLLIRDDSTAKFRELPIERTFLVEKEHDEPVAGWKHLFSNVWRFEGGDKLPKGLVTVSTERDYLMELLPGIIPESEKPDKSKAEVNPFTPKDNTVDDVDKYLEEVGIAQAFDILVEKMHSTSYEKVTQWLGMGLLGMIAALIIKVIIKQLGG